MGTPPSPSQQQHMLFIRLQASLPRGEKSGPGGSDGRRVLSGEEERDEQSHDLAVGVNAAVLVLHVHEYLHGVKQQQTPRNL